ncbi:MAG: DinB family protein [Acidobacteria bacterium]|nr:MAG: DinB family protein [Acidobacteriota bacterium]REK02422.1 MAG: DinB family protein [Acidobacteriota bacterium]REK13777.1 MAG: DinB family protein [Acidobacteriota bacterium]REK41771.1 MAG: DinB family protein [Acidobacteriota bacterium]
MKAESASENIAKEDLLKDLLLLVHETFEGSPEDGSAYLDRGTGVFSTVSGLGSGEVSADLNGTSIVAHVEHLKFYLDRLVEFIEGRTEPVNWDQSWLIDTVDDQEWEVLKAGLRKSYENVLRCFAEVPVWDQDKIGEAMAIIAHSAYHLGAIRQMAKAVRPQDKGKRQD